MVKESAKTAPKTDEATDSQLYLLSALIEDDKSFEIIKKHVVKVGSIVKEENLGKKALAYPINKHDQLILVSFFFTATPESISTLEGELRHEESIERYLLTTWRGSTDGMERRSERHSRTKTDAERAAT